MAKAALNMMTRTSATDYQADGIHMNSVDTGWVTDEDPAEIAARKTAEHRFHPPLDIVDGAARIVDPDHRRDQHRRARVGAVPEGLPADGLVILRDDCRSCHPERSEGDGGGMPRSRARPPVWARRGGWEGERNESAEEHERHVGVSTPSPGTARSASWSTRRSAMVSGSARSAPMGPSR